MRWSNFFHLYQPPAWDEEIVRRATDEAYRPLLDILRRHPDLRLTLNIAAALVEQLESLGLTDVLKDLKGLVERGQVELVSSAAYHPILPLLPAAEINRQLDLHDQRLRGVFGSAYQPRGFFPPEMAWGGPLEKILIDRGYAWVIIDEPAATGTVGEIDFSHRYKTPAGLGVVFRNRHLSDFLSFSANIDQPQAAVAALQGDRRSGQYLITAMDGENLGHHRPGVDKLWEVLVTWPDVTTATISQYRADLKTERVLDVLPSSWSSQPDELRHNIPFGLWHHPDNPIHQAQWELTYLVINAVTSQAGASAYDSARRLLDQALTSDKYWWASASPWWDATIVIRETQRLADVIASLENLPTSTKNKVERIMKRVASTVELWDKTGLAKQRQAHYLQASGAVHFMGGQQVTS